MPAEPLAQAAAVTASPAPGVALRAISLPTARALLRGERVDPGPVGWHPDYPLADTVTGLRLLIDAHQAAGWPGEPRPVWWLYQVVAGGEVVGDIGFHGPPDADGTVEIGYALVRPAWGRGIATAACRELLGIAWRAGATRVVADAAADNPASRRVLIKAGFRSGGAETFEIER